MTEAIEHRILLNLQSTFEDKIKVASGYHFTVQAGAVSIDPGDVSETMLGATGLSPFIFIERGPTGRPNYFHSSQMLELVQFVVWAAANAASLVPGSRDEMYTRLCADIEKAIKVDITRGETLVTDTRITSRQPWFGGGTPRVLAIIQLEVRVYRTYGSANG